MLYFSDGVETIVEHMVKSDQVQRDHTRLVAEVQRSGGYDKFYVKIHERGNHKDSNPEFEIRLENELKTRLEEEERRRLGALKGERRREHNEL